MRSIGVLDDPIGNQQLLGSWPRLVVSRKRSFSSRWLKEIMIKHASDRFPNEAATSMKRSVIVLRPKRGKAEADSIEQPNVVPLIN
jgi:hypothetical protein